MFVRRVTPERPEHEKLTSTFPIHIHIHLVNPNQHRVNVEEWMGKKGSWDNTYEGTGLSQSPHTASAIAHTGLTFIFYNLRDFRRGRRGVESAGGAGAGQGE